jgi:polyribonucleotide nucleotidyltransferase
LTTSQSFERIICGRKLTLETGKLEWRPMRSYYSLRGFGPAIDVCIAPKAKEGTDFLPLTVDYEEKMYAPEKSRWISTKRRAPHRRGNFKCPPDGQATASAPAKTWRREIQTDKYRFCGG